MSVSAERLTTRAQGGQARLACVAPALVAAIWPHVAHLIRRAMARGRMGRFADVEADVLGANAYLWLAVEQPGPARASDNEGASRASPTCGGAMIAAAVTKVTQDDGERLCTIVACAGRDWKRFGPLIAGLEAYARAEGCAAIEICGRPGWRRRLPDYRLARIVIRKRL